ncbi:MmcQ/YjbR family DNA-binding protein [Olivibacter sp. XZL3]|uniref:MmcQ/YjbR family DNA-binding protein n=1 Tax=Olivibacter sp. XZL3 TaxID=1735116 RepID=UPI0010649C0F|nr:MmcQ/YjbR family DNA-binding protein [Olivibacter sp. XZL3]
MNIEELRTYCLSKKGVTEGFPFGPDTLVFKVGGKVFLLTGLDVQPLSFNAKCDPERAIDLREQYPFSVFPGYHMNKKHWNTVEANGELSLQQLKDLIDHSYELVYNKLSPRIRSTLL